ncbi:MAG: acyl-CoA thioesterase [Stellaceae bacterium]
MLVIRRDLRIEWAQCDPAGIVFYPQYFVIFDTSTAHLFGRTGLSASAIRAKYRIVGFPLVECSAKFLLPCHFDDAVTIESRIGEWGRTSFTVQHRVLKDGKVAVEGLEKRIWASRHANGGIKPEPVPAEVKASLSDASGRTRLD